MVAPTAKVDAWMPLWIGDILAETMGLTRDQIGGYMLLLFAYWRNKGPLPDDDEAFAAIVRSSVEDWRERLRPRLAPFFMLQAFVWHHERTELELAKAGKNKAAAVQKAQKAAQVRWCRASSTSTAPGNAPNMPDATHEACSRDTPSPSPTTPSSLRSEGEPPARKATTPAAQADIPGVPPALLADWLAVRKAKRAGALTTTAVQGLLREAATAGITTEQAVRCCCEASWVGFRADWYLARVGERRAPAGGGAASFADRTTRRIETLAELTGQARDHLHAGGSDVIDGVTRLVD